MAIERFTITSTQDIVNLVDSLGWFDNVELSENMCKGWVDGISDYVLEAQFDNTFAFHTKGYSQSSSYEKLGIRGSAYCLINYAYKTQNGILFFGIPSPPDSGANSYYSCMIGKTQNGTIAFACAYNTGAYANYYRSAAVGETFTNMDGYAGYNLKAPNGGSQSGQIPKTTQIVSVPIPTFPDSGASYIKGSLGFIVAPFKSAGVVDINGIKYATNGALALNDED